MGKGRIPGTPIIVDTFRHRGGRGRDAEVADVQCLYFCTHVHGDHVEGLSHTWDHGPIYCSPVTAALLGEQFRLAPGVLQPLSVDEPHVIPLEPSGRLRMSVTLVDANHCPGAVMLLLQGYFGTVLHTGDFRFSRHMLAHPALRYVCDARIARPRGLAHASCGGGASTPADSTSSARVPPALRAMAIFSDRANR